MHGETAKFTSALLFFYPPFRVSVIKSKPNFFSIIVNLVTDHCAIDSALNNEMNRIELFNSVLASSFSSVTWIPSLSWLTWFTFDSKVFLVLCIFT